MKIILIFLLGSIYFSNEACFAQTILSKRLDSLFTTYQDSGFSGAVFVQEKNKHTLKKGYGYSNNENKTPNTAKTLFNVASIGKHFTVFSILLLEKKRMLNTSDYLAKYIGPFNDIRDSLTIHQLLIHRSGLTVDGAPLDYSTKEKFIQTVKNAKPDSIPGKKYRYSNAGFSMLAAVVEIVSNQPFEEFLLRNVFEPTEMKNTGYPWEKRMNKSLFATGYNNKREAQPVQTDIWAARGPGNLVTSVEDLGRWMEAFQDDKFVSKQMRDKILFDYYPGEDGYGWNKSLTSRKTRFIHKGGGRADFENRMMWYPDDGVLIIFCINNDYNLARILFNKIRSMMD